MFDLNQMVRHARSGVIGAITIVGKGEVEVMSLDHGYSARWVNENVIPLTNEEIDAWYAGKGY